MRDAVLLSVRLAGLGVSVQRHSLISDRLGDPLIYKLAACSTSLWSSAAFVIGPAVSSRNIRAYLDSSDVTSEVADATLWLSWS